MFANERKNLIKKLLLDKGVISVAELSEMLNVSEVTIRRDFERLEKENFLVRSHGGAIINPESYNLGNVDFFENSTESEEISFAAIKVLEDNDSIFIGSGEICFAIAKNLPERKALNVLTNNLRVAMECSKKGINTIVIGGNVDTASQSTYGDMGLGNLSNIYVNKAIIEANSINLRRGVNINNNKELALLEKIIEISEEKVILCKPMDFDKNSLVKLCDFDKVNKIVTSNSVDDKYKSFFFEKGISLILSFVK